MPKGVVEGSGGHKIDFRGMQKEAFIKENIKSGVFDGLNKNFKEEDMSERPAGMPGLVGRSIAISKKANKRKEKLERKQREAEDRDGKHLDKFG